MSQRMRAARAIRTGNVRTFNMNAGHDTRYFGQFGACLGDRPHAMGDGLEAGRGDRGAELRYAKLGLPTGDARHMLHG